MIWRKEEITLEIGLSSTIALPLFSAFTILLNASFNILLPIPLSHSDLVTQTDKFHQARTVLFVNRELVVLTVVGKCSPPLPRDAASTLYLRLSTLFQLFFFGTFGFGPFRPYEQSL